MGLFSWLSRRKNTGPGPIPPGTSPGYSVEGEPLPADLVSICDILQLNTKNINELFTAMNRIERKQNRWLEVLNLKEGQPAAEQAPPEPAAEETLLEPGHVGMGPLPAGFLSGEPTEE